LQDTVAAIAAEAAAKVSGPRVEIINGKIVIKESSLVVNNDTTIEGEYEEVTEGIYATATYSSFLQRKRSSAWSVDETRFFYQTLRQCGTEFSMMQNFFPSRTRKQLKLKFFREEKSHPELVNHALNSSLPLELSPFEAKLGKLEEENDIEEKEENEVEENETVIIKSKTIEIPPPSNIINISAANESTNPIYDDEEELIDV
jgi:transcription factor TFIIIB component B''